jgi:magnesium-protoporphyrin IX monomethyl ester (oxidative) cyclase
MRLAYSFEDEKRPRHMHRAMSDAPGHEQLQEVVRYWNDLWRHSKPVLQVSGEGDGLRIRDTRPCAIQSYWTISGVAAEIYRQCDSAQPLSMFKSADIETLLNNKIMLAMNGKLLAIGVNSA